MVDEIFVLGNAPSLNDFDLNRLAGRDVFVCNRFYLYPGLTWTPTYYTVADEGVLFDYWDEIMAYAATVKQAWFPSQHPIGIGIECLVDLPNVSFYDLKWGNFYLGDKPLTIGLNGTVANVMIQLAYEMGYKTIYLLGVDINYKLTDTMQIEGRDAYSHGPDPNHFDPDYFGVGHHFHTPSEQAKRIMLNNLASVYIHLKLRGVKLVNLSKTSNFTTCDFANFDEVTA